MSQSTGGLRPCELLPRAASQTFTEYRPAEWWDATLSQRTMQDYTNWAPRLQNEMLTRQNQRFGLLFPLFNVLRGLKLHKSFSTKCRLFFLGGGGCTLCANNCYVTHQWQPGQCRSERVCTYLEGAGTEKRGGHEELAPGSQRVPRRVNTSLTGTPLTAPTAATHIKPS